MAALLHLFLFILVGLLIAGGILVWIIWSTVRKATQSLKRPYKKKSKTDENIIDRRNPDTANRKIIPKDEGEYVDFTEV